MNLEMAVTEKMLRIAIELQPGRLPGPERRAEVTTEGAWVAADSAHRDRGAQLTGRGSGVAIHRSR